jgi:hypothetical protein
MLDIFNIPSNNTTQYFYANSGSWQTWQKPRNAKFIQIFCLGSGAGGTSGVINNGNANGGRGGGSAGLVRGIIPAFLLPDTLYIQVPIGGIGGNGNNIPGNSGSISYISLAPTASTQTLIAASSTLPAGPVAAATVAVTSTFSFSNIGIFTATSGVVGAVANTGLSTFIAGTLVTGGAGGGTKTSADASISPGGTITGSFPASSFVLGGAPTGSNGGSGYYSLKPFYALGGAGGAAGSQGGGLINGGRGGNGAYGCGGGGGGGAPLTGTSIGGNGGDGLVIITTIT